MRQLLIFTLTFFFSAASFSATLNVPSGSYPTIQSGINAALNGDTVLVAPGTYMENIDFLGKAITVKSENGPNTTIIDGKRAGNTVTFKSKEWLDSVLEGFTVRNGSGNCGGGVHCDDSSPTIIRNIISGNSAGFFGSGGGIGCIYESHPEIFANIIIGNTANMSGGGIYCFDVSSPLMRNNFIIGNKTVQVNFGGGGGIACVQDAKPTITNNTFCANVSPFGGGAVYTASGSLPYITNTILWGNVAPKGKEIYISANPSPSCVNIAYSAVEGAETSVFRDTNCSYFWGPGMVNSDPRFVDSPSSDYHLRADSSCIDAGSNTAIYLPLLDFEGDPRRFDVPTVPDTGFGQAPIVDIGADEFYAHLYITGDQTPSGAIKVKLAGLPGTSPVYLIIGSGVREPPSPTVYGDLYLLPPRIFVPLTAMPASGVHIITTTLPSNPAPYDIPMQGLVGLNPDSLTNLCVLEVR